jgi:hypothetical protein
VIRKMDHGTPNKGDGKCSSALYEHHFLCLLVILRIEISRPSRFDRFPFPIMELRFVGLLVPNTSLHFPTAEVVLSC